MKDEPKPSTQNPTPSTLWKDLVAAEAAAPAPSTQLPAPKCDWRSWGWIQLADEDGNSRIFYAEKAYEAAVHQAYTTGIKDERTYQADLASKQRERRWLTIGAAFFFGFCAGMILAALMTWTFW